MADTIKLIIAVVVVITAIVLFYSYAEYSTWLRVLGLLSAVGLALFVASRTAMGGLALGYISDTQVEVRKVVWPTRQETMQTTMVVILMVIVAALILWLFDSLLGWAVRALTL